MHNACSMKGLRFNEFGPLHVTRLWIRTRKVYIYINQLLHQDLLYLAAVGCLGVNGSAITMRRTLQPTYVLMDNTGYNISVFSPNVDVYCGRDAMFSSYNNASTCAHTQPRIVNSNLAMSELETVNHTKLAEKPSPSALCPQMGAKCESS